MELFIGVDAEKVVVSPGPLRMARGRGRRRRYGSVTELVPVPASGRDRDERVSRTSKIALPLLGFCALAPLLDIPWWLPAVITVAILGGVVRMQARAARTGSIDLPKRESHVLVAPEERTAYARALVVSRRVRRTWPDLAGLIDPADADRALTRALEELAALMARRQHLRRLRAELAGVSPGDLPAASPALLALAAQRERVEDLWLTTGAQANRMLAGINSAALAGESLIREQRIHETARQAERMITQLAAPGAASRIDAAPELAERTAAVIDAYRDLGAATAR